MCLNIFGSVIVMMMMMMMTIIIISGLYSAYAMAMITIYRAKMRVNGREVS